MRNLVVKFVLTCDSPLENWQYSWTLTSSFDPRSHVKVLKIGVLIHILIGNLLVPFVLTCGSRLISATILEGLTFDFDPRSRSNINDPFAVSISLTFEWCIGLVGASSSFRVYLPQRRVDHARYYIDNTDNNSHKGTWTEKVSPLDHETFNYERFAGSTVKRANRGESLQNVISLKKWKYHFVL